MFEILCTESDFSGINSLKVMIFIDLYPKKLILFGCFIYFLYICTLK